MPFLRAPRIMSRTEFGGLVERIPKATVDLREKAGGKQAFSRGLMFNEIFSGKSNREVGLGSPGFDRRDLRISNRLYPAVEGFPMKYGRHQGVIACQRLLLSR